VTYGVGLRLDRGLVFMADTRTNAGLDDISTYRKMFHWSVPGERTITVLTSGNLGTSQALVGELEERVKAPGERRPSILESATMFQVAQLVGRTLREIIADHRSSGPQAEAAFSATVLVGGQIRDQEPRLFMVYPEGNFIETSRDTQFLQIGETKYGRPILLRSYDPALSFEEAVKLLLVSFDSTIKANLSVGPPLDLCVYPTDSLQPAIEWRFEADDPYYLAISNGWRVALREAFQLLPDFVLPGRGATPR
jgi:putative proteasome-type protease